MEKQWNFRFALPRPPEGPLVAVSAEETERALLKRLAAEKDQATEALWHLVRFCQQSKQFDKGLSCLRHGHSGQRCRPLGRFIISRICCSSIRNFNTSSKKPSSVVGRQWKSWRKRPRNSDPSFTQDGENNSLSCGQGCGRFSGGHGRVPHMHAIAELSIGTWHD